MSNNNKLIVLITTMHTSTSLICKGTLNTHCTKYTGIYFSGVAKVVYQLKICRYTTYYLEICHPRY